MIWSPKDSYFRDSSSQDDDRRLIANNPLSKEIRLQRILVLSLIVIVLFARI